MDLKKCQQKRKAVIATHEFKEKEPQSPFCQTHADWIQAGALRKAEGRHHIAMSARPIAFVGDGFYYFVDECAQKIVDVAKAIAAEFGPNAANERDKPWENGAIKAILEIAGAGVANEGGVPCLKLPTRTFNAANTKFMDLGIDIISTDLHEPKALPKFAWA